MPGAAGSPPDHVIPDATFAPHEKRLFRGAPSAEGYAESRSVAYGRLLPLPPPFAFDLETSELA
ncbi:hypothetical protein [Streptomyces roseifaciens]|uniref:hypothetical protein n=1 Tax=Streptomyces roseifaciens TaxID=1488406 RepID=UPI0007180840|nr:hypothetical protein [Streptomyces roseifaciens]